ncbi:hypothetical protein SERLA73DRAFT_118443 [Serpula lacrymans var. lacrymans S7.3]|uniref:Uncharacterized protein n=1 Tax=Serpula lacrymans var. lacrymans (strain S7.3) TaxID=936435 RepID=F8PEW0_SERL3|nr:hypothetical protein SERLA73DRAFT_118443 [Serpula lacrymans var. lacrymans S7.3]
MSLQPSIPESFNNHEENILNTTVTLLLFFISARVSLFAVYLLNCLATSILRITLRIIGFGSKGPVKKTPAASIQARLYGGRIPQGGSFASSQRAGMVMGR